MLPVVKLLVVFWEWCVCLNVIFLYVLSFKDVLIDGVLVALLKSVSLSRVVDLVNLLC